MIMFSHSQTMMVTPYGNWFINKTALIGRKLIKMDRFVNNKLYFTK